MELMQQIHGGFFESLLGSLDSLHLGYAKRHDTLGAEINQLSVRQTH